MAQTEESNFTHFCAALASFPLDMSSLWGGVRRRDTCQVTQEHPRKTNINSATDGAKRGGCQAGKQLRKGLRPKTGVKFHSLFKFT